MTRRGSLAHLLLAMSVALGQALLPQQVRAIHDGVYDANAAGVEPGQLQHLLETTHGDVTLTSRNMPPYRMIMPGARQQLASMACESLAIVEAVPRSSESHFTADHSAIYTEWSLHALAVFKDRSDAPRQAGDTLTALQLGGVMTLPGGRRVTLTVLDRPPFDVGTDYLFFFYSLLPSTGALARPIESIPLVADAVRERRPGALSPDLKNLTRSELVATLADVVTAQQSDSHCRHR